MFKKIKEKVLGLFGKKKVQNKDCFQQLMETLDNEKGKMFYHQWKIPNICEEEELIFVLLDTKRTIEERSEFLKTYLLIKETNDRFEKEKEIVNESIGSLFGRYNREKDNNCLNPIQMQKNREELRNNVFSKEEYNKHAFSKSKKYDECENDKKAVKRVIPLESDDMIDKVEV